MQNRLFLFICLTALLSMAPFAASATSATDIRYVTDELRLGLYSSEETTGRSLKTLTSGAQLEVLERALMSVRVKTEAGDVGWVKTAYLVTTEPAKRRVNALELANESIKAELEITLADVEESKFQVDSLTTELQYSQSQITELPALEAEVAQLRAVLAATETTVSVKWLVAAVIGAIIFGWFAGYQWLDRKVRKQFGGVRLY